MAGMVGARRSGLLLGLLVLAHVIVISHQVDGGGGVSLLERSILTALSPFQRATAGTVHGAQGIWGAYADLRGVHSENLVLRERLSVLELKAQRLEDEARQARRLRQILELRGVLPAETIVAEVIARDGLPWFRTLAIDKGREAGVGIDSPVISSSGVVGRVIGVGSGVARVQLIWDRDCGVGVRVERSRVTGVASGRVGLQDADSAELAMRYVPLLADVVAGDIVVTSGLDRIFPKGLTVGRVSAIGAAEGMFKEVFVTPSAGFHRLEEVLVMRPLPEEPPVTEAVQVKLVWIGLALAGALMVQSGLGLVVPEYSRMFDPFLLVVVFCGLALGGSMGLGVGATAGWIQDVHFGGTVLGLSALTRLLLGYGVGAAGSRLFLGSAGARILVLFAATVADAWVFEGLSSMFGLAPTPVSGFDLTVRGAANAFIGAVIFAALDRRRRQQVRP